MLVALMVMLMAAGFVAGVVMGIQDAIKRGQAQREQRAHDLNKVYRQAQKDLAKGRKGQMKNWLAAEERWSIEHLRELADSGNARAAEILALLDQPDPE